MKRSEMIEHIAQELLYVAVDEGLYKTAHPGYFQRKAADLLDMIEGFGMQPPAYVNGYFTAPYLGCGSDEVEWVEESVNEWEPEDETQ